MGSQEHRDKAAKAFQSVPCAIVTVSDTRTFETDTSGQRIRHYLEAEGHSIVAYHIVKDEAEQIEDLLEKLTSADQNIRVILLNGGTGIAPRDRTYDVIARKLEKTLTGFGELFRMLSYQ
ncbi:MAG: molybdenum cofactor biosynthesis protein, partial [Phototrophicales bacterium]